MVVSVASKRNLDDERTELQRASTSENVEGVKAQEEERRTSSGAWKKWLKKS